ncbi:(2Fe-2S)-binding protein [Romboutsia weinsteinii]|uniref:(2Fe-2S)-binding protein n=1 Tax=Romboutsia weinsteinii TaxID=2020949 RepID=A0A371J5V6_9FIRM|nr:(2Fe-2S)-binding protein [Romboutsia weinsteinii]RDY28063.1 (2Fe-2S)-binding protein [Romboutsia weinsteinii]
MKIITDDYIKVRNAMSNGARTLDDIKDMTDITIDTTDLKNDIESILQNACKCRSVSVEEVVKAIQNGADTVEKIGEVTKAGTACGRCKGLLNNIIDTTK